MSAAAELLNAAVAHHTGGRPGEAVPLYRRVLDLEPDNADALHLLGLAVAGTGRSEGTDLIRRALAVRPGFPDAAYNLGNILRRSGQPDAAASVFRQAFALTGSPRDREMLGLTLIEDAVSRAGGLPALNAVFNAIHLHNRTEPGWRAGGLAGLGASGRATLLARVGEALDLLPRHAMVAYLAMMVFVADGDLERALEIAVRPTDDPNPDLSRLAAEIAWYLRRAGDARLHYAEFIRRKCLGEAPLRPLLPDVAGAEPFVRRPRPPARRPVLIYTHYGNPDYLHYSIGQSLIANPAARIVLIGDRENRIDGVEHHLIHDHAALSAEIVSLYRHDSGNAYCYELFCIARWFIFLDLCRRQGFEEMFFLDSDYMLFCDLEAERERFAGTGVGFSLNSAHFSYFTIDRLAEFCDHIAAVFRSGEDTRSFHSRNNSDLFSDMAFIFDYQRGHPWHNFCERRDGTVFDSSITDAGGFRTTAVERAGVVKDIRFEDGLPYGWHEESGQAVRFLGLHFQGHSKALMREAFFRRRWGRG